LDEFKSTITEAMISKLSSGQCCRSESEIIRIFWLDPNPKKSSDSDPDTVVNKKFFFVKNRRSNTFFSVVQIIGHIKKAIRGIILKKFRDKILVQGSESEKNEFGSTTLALTNEAFQNEKLIKWKNNFTKLKILTKLYYTGIALNSGTAHLQCTHCPGTGYIKQIRISTGAFKLQFITAKYQASRLNER
jgi:hypothetical protein